jgi:hypothetical protein
MRLVPFLLGLGVALGLLISELVIGGSAGVLGLTTLVMPPCSTTRSLLSPLHKRAVTFLEELFRSWVGTGLVGGTLCIRFVFLSILTAMHLVSVGA